MVFFCFYTKKIRFILSLIFLSYSFYLPQWPVFSAQLPVNQFFSIDTLADAAVFEVTNTFDPTNTTLDPTYTGSLRQAIDLSNSNGEADTIYFNTTVTTIFLNSTITISENNLTLTGTKDPTGINGPGVELTPTIPDTTINSLEINSNDNFIMGIAIYSFGINGILINGNGNTVIGCHLGTDISGTMDKGNGGNGLQILGGNSNIIGGDIDSTAQRNVICSNLYGLTVSGTNNTIQGNYIGVDLTGTTPLGNSARGLILNGSNNTIGGGTSSSANIIADSGYGIEIASDSDLIQGNYVGTGRAGTEDLGHDFEALTYSFGSRRSKVINNVMAFNDTGGIAINSIVITSTGNKFSQNSIYDNGGLGIDLGNDGVTLNDLDDTDTGPNNYVNFPVITQIRIDGSGNLTITGTLDIGGAETTATIEIFIADNNPSNNNNHGEGKTYLGSTMPVSDVTGSWSITITGTGVVVGDLITVDTTDSSGNTSEFSLNVTVTLDTDGDGILDSTDNCDSMANADQLDTDSDGSGNACDSDDDNDGVSDNSDAFPEDPTEAIDTDHDGLGNNTDQDDDSDGFSDTLENSVGSDALSNGSFPKRLNAVYFDTNNVAAVFTIINYSNLTKTMVFNIYDNDGGFVFGDTGAVDPKAGGLFNLLDTAVSVGMGAHTLGHIELFYSGNSGDVSANVSMPNVNGVSTSPCIDLQNIGSNILGGVWLVSKDGDASVYATNVSDNSIRAYIRTYDQDGNILSYEEFILSGHQMRTFAMPDEKIGYVRIVLIDGNAGDVLAQLVITDTKYGNSSHLLVDPNLQLSNEVYKDQSNMGHKVAPIMYKPIVQGKDSKGFIILANIGYTSIDVYTSLLKKDGQVKLNKATIPSYGTIKQKIHTATDEKIYGVDIYHEGEGSAVVGNVLVSNGNTSKSAVSYALMDTTPSDLNTSTTISDRGFDITNGAKAKVILRNISDAERNVTLNFYNLEGVLLATTNVTIKKNKIAKVSINKFISEETLGYVELVHDGSAGDVKGTVVMTFSQGFMYQSPLVDRVSQT